MPLRRSAFRPIALALGVAAAATAGLSCGAGDRPLGAGGAVVARVVDGDTVRVSIGGGVESVRLIGVDTPETHGPGGLRECFGEEASRRLHELLPDGTAVRIVRDAEARDRYDRLLAYVYRIDDGLFVNLALARDGFAAALTIPPNVAHSEEIVAAVAEARAAARGLWGRCGGADTPLGGP